MSAFSSLNNPTLLDVARRQNPDGSIATVAEVMNETNEILPDMSFIECNDGTGHLTTIRSGIPKALFRRLYQGTPTGKSPTYQVKDSCGMLEARSLIDAKLLKFHGNSNEFRMSEELAFVEGMNQTLAETIFYGDTETHPERFTGLSPRFNAFGGSKTESSHNVFDGGGRNGSGHSSIWFSAWGPLTGFGLYPKGTQAGLVREDLGNQEVPDEFGNRFTAVETKYQMDVGLCVRDWRAFVRIANLDSEALQSNNGAADLFKLLTMAYRRQKGRKLGRAAIYCNETVWTCLDLQAQAKENLNLTYRNIGGENILAYRGIPIRECEALLETEAVVPAA